MVNKYETKESIFIGGYWNYIFLKIGCYLLIVLSASLLFPVARVILAKYMINNTIINGKQLLFIGSIGDFYWQCIKWILLSIVTLGIYLFVIEVKYKKWETKNTVFIR